MEKSGFELIREAEMPEVGGIARLWKHGESGAEVLSVVNQDENKCFGVNFYTPPRDSTGVAHILEHSVLGGSEKYRVREPFVELLKGSLQTFLNAFTFPDKTCYPVASANLQDFYNLIEVYLDAVFHPLLTENTFRQEGWHVEVEESEKPWSYKGVVFNEMKGVYSQGDSMLAELSQQVLFPDNLYSLDSGGNPEKIPDLTWEQFRDFHRRHYNPSNARFFFWGDDPEERRLEIVARAIGNHKKIQREPPVPLQGRFKTPREITAAYPAAEDEKRALFTINWLLPERADVLQALKFEMLEHILEGLPGSPLRRALIESGLGEDTTGCGLETDLRQMYYSTGLKGIAPEDVEKAEKLALETLKDLAENGIPDEAVESAINSVEFVYRENNSGRFPRGLAAMIQALSTWLYEGDPIDALAWEKPLAEIKRQVASGEKVFENAIREYFLENPHRVRVTLLPDEKMAEERRQRENSKLEKLRESSSAAEKAAYARITAELQKVQTAPDDPAAIARIPTLRLSDLPKEARKISSEFIGGSTSFLSHDLPTNGILYANLLLPIEVIPESLIPLIPLFSRALIEMGTKNRDYASLGLEIAARTGGIGAAPIAGLTMEEKTPFLYLGIQGKAVESHVSDLFDIFSEILLEPQQNKNAMLDRLYRMALEEKARLEYGLQAAGHAAVSARIRSKLRPEQALNEKFSGISQLRFLQNLEKRLKEEPEKVLKELEQLRSLVVTSRNAILDLTASGSLLETGLKAGRNLAERLPANPGLTEGMEIKSCKALTSLPKNEAFLTQGQINYTGKGANLYDLGYKYHGSSSVIMRWLRMGPLWENVRILGGAYGAMCSLDKAGGTFVCASYRDPEVGKTLETYDRLGFFARNFRPDQTQLTQAIIGAIGDVDAYLLPDARGARALAWHLAGETEETRQRTRDEILGTTEKDFHDFAEFLDVAGKEGSIAVMGGTKAAEAARRAGWVTETI